MDEQQDTKAQLHAQKEQAAKTQRARPRVALPTADDWRDFGRALAGCFRRPPQMTGLRWWVGVILFAVGVVPLATALLGRGSNDAVWANLILGVWAPVGLHLMGRLWPTLEFIRLIARWTFSCFAALMAWAALASIIAALLAKIVPPIAGVVLANSVAGVAVAGTAALWLLRRMARAGRERPAVTSATPPVVPAAPAGGGDSNE